jgi:hypothetical protein
MPARSIYRLRRGAPCLAAATAAALTACSLLLTAPAGASPRGAVPAGAATTSAFTAVSCPAAKDCWAAGSVNSGEQQAEIYHWNGSTWTQVPLKSPSRTATVLDSVSCPTVSLCWAVGQQTPAAGSAKAYDLRWNGKRWSAGGAHLLASPAAVFCGSAANCWVAGGAAIEHWNGGKWAPVPTPSALASLVSPALYCVSSRDCWVTGATAGLQGTRIGHWNGHTWRSVGIQTASRHNTYFPGVSCLSATECLTAAADINGGAPPTLSWNGLKWVFSPPVSSPTAGFEAVSCAAGLGCMAVGYSGTNESLAFGELWTGTQWQPVGNVAPQGGPSQLNGISCITKSDCWAVGTAYSAISKASLNLIERWNGTDWSVFH